MCLSQLSLSEVPVLGSQKNLFGQLAPQLSPSEIMVQGEPVSGNNQYACSLYIFLETEQRHEQRFSQVGCLKP